MALLYQDYRCGACHKLLFKGVIIEGEVEVKCKRCQEMTMIQASNSNKFICGLMPCPNRVPLEIKK